MLERVRRSPAVVDLSAGCPVVSDGPAVPEHVWYVSYGSNLLAERFAVYLLGGRVPGLDRTYPGGPSTAPALDERPVVLPGRLVLALDAPQWGGGGVAFWDPCGDGPGVLARAWRVTLRQYLEVVHLENGGTHRQAARWPAQVLRDGTALLDDGWYGRLVLAGRIAGEPVLTFTHPRPGGLTHRAPSDRYADVVTRGLLETFGRPAHGGLTAADADGYLTAASSR